jgi:hypothetical protein
VPWLIPADAAATTSSTILETIGMHQHCNFLDLEVSSEHSWLTGVLIIFQTISAVCKSFVPPEHSTMAEGFPTRHLLHHLKCFHSRFG